MDVVKSLTEGNIGEEGIKDTIKNVSEKVKTIKTQHKAIKQEQSEDMYIEEIKEFKNKALEFGKKLVTDDHFHEGDKYPFNKLIDETFKCKIGKTEVEFSAEICFRDDNESKVYSGQMVQKVLGKLPKGYDFSLKMGNTVNLQYIIPKKYVSEESIDIIALLSDPDNIAEEGIIKKEKSHASPEQAKHLEQATSFIISEAKKAISNASDQFKEYTDYPDIVDDGETYVIVGVCYPGNFDYLDKDESKKMWNEWKNISRSLNKAGKSKFPDLVFSDRPEDPGVVYIRVR